MKISTNKHIELVKKWLADSDSVSQQELEDSRDAAADAYWADDAADYAYAAAYAAAAYDYAAYADAAAADAAYWVKRYEELTACGKKR
tara:strand:- start:167 stop:430 length:264 start_codon:yes stop_codon:yes gene_type:complete